MSTTPADLRRVKEKVEILNGERGDKGRAAFLRAEARKLQENVATLENVLRRARKDIKNLLRHIDLIQETTDTTVEIFPLQSTDVPGNNIPGISTGSAGEEVTSGDFNSLLGDVIAVRDALETNPTPEAFNRLRYDVVKLHEGMTKMKEALLKELPQAVLDEDAEEP